MSDPEEPARAGMVERLGGREGLRAILTRFYATLATDPMLGHHFAGRDLERITEGQLAFLLKAFGATKRYEGRHPKDAHSDLAPILAGQFDRRMKLLEARLDADGVGASDRDRWLAVERSMRGVLVREP